VQKATGRYNRYLDTEVGRFFANASESPSAGWDENEGRRWSYVYNSRPLRQRRITSKTSCVILAKPKKLISEHSGVLQHPHFLPLRQIPMRLSNSVVSGVVSPQHNFFQFVLRPIVLQSHSLRRKQPYPEISSRITKPCCCLSLALASSRPEAGRTSALSAGTSAIFGPTQIYSYPNFKIIYLS